MIDLQPSFGTCLGVAVMFLALVLTPFFLFSDDRINEITYTDCYDNYNNKIVGARCEINEMNKKNAIIAIGTMAFVFGFMLIIFDGMFNY